MDEAIKPKNNRINQASKVVLNILGGAIPYVGGILSAASGFWSEYDQEKVNDFLTFRNQLLENEIKEQFQMFLELDKRLEELKEDVSERIKSRDFHGLVQRCFRNWSDYNSHTKREYIKNILINAAATEICNNDVIKLFIDWISQYSELHFQVIAQVYHHHNGISRGQIWQNLGKENAREDSAEADLYKLLIRDLSTGGIIRQARQTDYHGNYISSLKKKSSPSKSRSSNVIESAFEMNKLYVLTDLGRQFVHYALTDVPTKIDFDH